MSLCEHCCRKGVVSVGNAIDFYDLCLDCFKASCGETHTYTSPLSPPPSPAPSRCVTDVSPRLGR